VPGQIMLSGFVLQRIRSGVAIAAIAIVLGGVVLLIVEVRRAREQLEPGALPVPVAGVPRPGHDRAGRDGSRAAETETPAIGSARVAPSVVDPTEASRLSRGQAGIGSVASGDPGGEVDERRRLVGRSYDVGDYEAALDRAAAFLLEQPSDEYVMRVAAVSACALGDEDRARRYYAAASASSRETVARRCRRFGVEL
jgi:hypothetical protein